MDKRCVSPCFSLFVLVSLMTHVVELAFSALLGVTLYRDVAHRDVFFSLTAGVIILPLVLVQLVSAIFLLRRRGDAMSGGEAALMGVLHVLQLAFLWRHLGLLMKRKPASLLLRRKHELREMLLLRLIFTFAGGFPLLLLQTYLLLTRAPLGWPWALHASLVASALSVAWSLTTVQQAVRPEEDGRTVTLILWSWPALLFTWLWRVGEMVSRALCLALFAVLYHQWVLLVLGLHWLVMLLCLSLPQTVGGVSSSSSSSSFSSSSTTSAAPLHRVVMCLVTSYSYVWCYVSLSRVRTAVWYTLYYVIMFLENCTLSIVWLTKTEEDTFTSRYLLVVVSTLAFLISMACLLVFYRHFHLLPHPASTTSITTDTTTSNNNNASTKEVLGTYPGCNHHCHHHHHHRHHHDDDSKHPHSHHHNHHHRGPASEWSSGGQCRSAVSVGGQCYKYGMHDSLLDSASDVTSSAMPPHHRGCQHHPHHSNPHPLKGGDRHLQKCDADEVSERCACSCSCGAWRRGEGDGVSVVSCQTARSTANCPHPHGHPHHHPSRRGGGGGGNRTSRSDMTDSTSVLTLASGASHNLGYEGSYDTQSNTVPAWLPSGDSLIAKHLLALDTACPGGSAPDSEKEWALRQEKSMERYRCLLKQEAQRWGSEGYPPYAHPALLDRTKLPQTHPHPHHRPHPPTSPASWDLHAADSSPRCQACSCCDLTTGDSRVSSIFRAAPGTDRCCPCPDCQRPGGGREDSGVEEGLYGGVPPGHLSHHPHQPSHPHHPKEASSSSPSNKDASSSDSEKACPCCCQHQHHYHHHHHQQQQQQQCGGNEGKRYHSQPNIFTIWQQEGQRCGDGEGPDPDLEPDRQDGKRCVSDSEGVSRKHGGVAKKTKHSEKKRSRGHGGAGSTGRKREAPSPANDTAGHTADSRPVPSPVPATLQADDTTAEKTASGKPVPSKLQVKAIAEKSDDDSSPTRKSIPSTSTTSSEPIYENVSVSVEDDSVHQLPATTTSDKLPAHAAHIIKDKESAAEVPLKKGSAFTTRSTNKEDDNGGSGSSGGSSKRNKDSRESRPAKKELTQTHRTSTDTQEMLKKRKSPGPGGDKQRCGGPGLRQEAWYMCSESEDSALPPETFSSSVDDGFTATDLDSDGSFELII